MFDSCFKNHLNNDLMEHVYNFLKLKKLIFL